MTNTKALTFVTLMIIIALSAVFLRVAIKQLMQFNISQNESGALETLKLISTALENYSHQNRGRYPPSVYALTRTSPPYLDKDYVGQSPIKGYNYICARLEPFSYSCSASPIRCRMTGKKTYAVTTGGALQSDDCAKQEGVK